MSREPHPIPDYLLEQYILGEVSEADRHRIDVRLETDAELVARIEAMRASNERILAYYPAKVFAAQVREKAAAANGAADGAADTPAATLGPHGVPTRTRGIGSRMTPPRRRWLTLGSALAAAAVVVLLLTVPRDMIFTGGDEPTRVVAPTERSKGLTPALRVYKQGSDTSGARQAVLLDPGSEVAEGDLLQIGYLAPGAQHGVILSIDGRGALSLHHPQTAGGSTALESDGEVLLPRAYELDDAPGFERFFLITSQQSIDVAAILKAARALAADSTRAADGVLELSTGWNQYSVRLLKRETRS